MGRLQDETLRGTKWQMVNSLTMQPLSFLAGMAIARLIAPDQFGVIALLDVYFSIAAQLYTCGFGTALIRKQNRTEVDCSTVFWFNIVICGACALILCACSPLIASSYGIPDLCPLTIIAAASMFMYASCGVHKALFSARLEFRIPAIINIVVGLTGLAATIILGCLEFGYWAFSLANFISALLSVIIIWKVSPWKPKLLFSWVSFREFFAYGVRISITTMVTNLYDGSRQFIIGKIYSPLQLAFFGRAFGFCSMPIGVVNGLWKSVALPILATVQDDIPRLVNAYRQYIRVSSLIILWGMMTLVACAPSLLYCLYGDRWLPCVPYMRALCIGIMFNPLTFINENIYLVRGRTDVLLRREIIFRVFGIVVLVLGAMHSVMGICIAAAASGIFCCMVSIVITRKIIPLTAWQQIQDFGKHLILATTVNIPIYFLNELPVSPFIIAPASVIGSAAMYAAILWMLKDDAFFRLLGIVKEKWQKRRQRKAMA